MHYSYVILLFLGLAGPCFCENIILGIKYKNFTNHEGKVADGTCCGTNSTTTTNCSADKCVTQFQICATTDWNSPCGAFYQRETGRYVSYSAGSFVVDEEISNGDGVDTDLQIFIKELNPNKVEEYALYFVITAVDKTGEEEREVGTFTFIIDWLDPIYAEPPSYKHLLLKREMAELGIDVFSQCNKHYYGAKCDVFCEPSLQYSCSSDGSKICYEDWEGDNCDKKDACFKGRCQNGGTCLDFQNDYACLCLLGFTGRDCEILPPTTTTTQKAPTSTVTASNELEIPIETAKPIVGKSQGLWAASSENDFWLITGVGGVVGLLVLLSLATVCLACIIFRRIKRTTTGVMDFPEPPPFIKENNMLTVSNQVYEMDQRVTEHPYEMEENV